MFALIIQLLSIYDVETLELHKEETFLILIDVDRLDKQDQIRMYLNNRHFLLSNRSTIIFD